MTGYVDSLPKVYDDAVSFIMDVESVSDGSKNQQINGQIQVTVEGMDNPPEPGSKVSLISSPRSLKSFGNPGCFDYARHMLFEGVKARCNVKSDAISFSEPEKNSLMWTANRFRLKAGKAIDRVAPEESAIIKALITGDTSGISPEVRDTFNRTGAGHLIAISGLNIGIIAAASFWFSKYLLSFWPFLIKRGLLIRAASFASIFPVLFYGLISGLEPSALRAVIMASVFLAAGVLSRENDILNTLAASAFIILVLMPGSLFSISFILSYMAVLFIVLPAPVFNFIKNRADKTNIYGKISYWLKQSLAVSFFATIGTAPFVMHYFGNFSPIGIPANLILIPLFGSIAVVPGLLAVFILPFSETLFTILAKMTAIPVRIGTNLIKYLSEFSFASFQTISPDAVEVAIIYAILFSGIALLNMHFDKGKNKIPPKTSKIVRAAFVTALILLILDTAFSIKSRYFNENLMISVIDVGHGNSALVQFPYGKTMIVDGGGFLGKGRLDTGKDIVAPFLRRKKILALDYMVLSHHDIDHMKGLVFLAENFNPSELWEGADKSESWIYDNLLKSLSKNEIKIHDIHTLPESVGISGVNIDFIKPDDQKYETELISPNDRSLVMKLVYKGKSVLFTGDITERAEAEIIESYPEKIKADILLLPHHGSNYSGSDAFLDTVEPETGIISTGRKNFPGNSLLQRLEQRNISVWRTDSNGCVTTEINGNGYKIKAYQNVQQ